MIRAVIDTNVLVSALINPLGNEATVLLAIEQRRIVPLFSAEILQEYAEVLGRPKFSFSPEEIKEVLSLIESKGASMVSKTNLGLLPDPEDEKFLTCALVLKAQFIITGNKRHFPDGKYESTKIVNAVELLELIAFEM